jgi:hypothetical protein
VPGGNDAVQLDASFVSRVRVGLHTDCPVLFGRAHGQVFATQPWGVRTEYVDHVLSASVNLRAPGARLQSAEAEALRQLKQSDAAPLRRLCRGLLRAAYEGAYLAAIVRRRRALYLTLVGGGCFANPLPLIVHEIVRAHARYSGHPACRLEHVTICVFSETAVAQVQQLVQHLLAK